MSCICYYYVDAKFDLERLYLLCDMHDILGYSVPGQDVYISTPSKCDDMIMKSFSDKWHVI
jgi:hypothetical protein